LIQSSAARDPDIRPNLKAAEINGRIDFGLGPPPLAWQTHSLGRG
jgi:hypothetical protein